MQKVNETAVEQLNRMYGSFLEIKCLPIEVNMKSHPVTLAGKTEGAFTLNDSVSATTRNLNNIYETQADQGIIRANIGLASSSKMLTDLGYGYFYLSILKNAMLMELSKFFNLNDHKVIWSRPGKVDEFFRDFDNVAGYEVRAYIDKSQIQTPFVGLSQRD